MPTPMHISGVFSQLLVRFPTFKQAAQPTADQAVIDRSTQEGDQTRD